MPGKVLMILLLGLIALPAVAGEGFDAAGSLVRLAQFSPEERRMLRERWEMASPEERMEMRRQIMERWQKLSPEEREVRRRQMPERRGNAMPEQLPRDGWGGQRGPAGDFGGFGTGFERRHRGPPGDSEMMPRYEFPPEPYSGSGRPSR